ncbi:FAD-dependent oxidoreductase [Rhodococcus sp. 15-649-1-2]|nr:FAD-dependent oxidoreductase [Rhodococcus sp. 15-649-1-2]OZC78375.1 FAD-dependent oxidoreductase [Rhodococcus sp. 06-418-1B]OZE85029.1 FAD-dependent oxidoreductase [Rhodococcus sp. 15-649-1-2]
MKDVSVIGGGIAGLTAAVSCAEAGWRVTLYEAHSTLGGRGRATDGPYTFHDGGHVFYTGGNDYRWLRSRGFVTNLGWPSLSDLSHVGFRIDGTLRRTPPASMLRALSHRWLTAPVDEDFDTWASRRWGSTTARQMANAIAVTTYDADTGRLSAAFVWNLLQRVLGPRIPTIRWVRGGWQKVIDRMVSRASELGARLETRSRMVELPPGPTIVATELASARTLLGDQSLSWTSGHCVLLDLAVESSRSDGTTVFDLDEGGFHESYSMYDDSVAPSGQSLYQMQMPVRSGEPPSEARNRLERFADSVAPGYTHRTTFTRNGSARTRTGAVDLPGYTWRDRPSIHRGDGVYLVGDMVAAPGMRGEIAVNSALFAAQSITRGK